MSIKKNKFGIVILAGILVCIVIGLTSYIIYDKFTSKEELANNNAIVDQKEEIKETITDLSLDDDIVKDLSVKIIGIYTNQVGKRYNDYFYQKDKIILETEPLSFKLSLAAETIDDELFQTTTEGYDCNDGLCGISYIDEEKVKNAYDELFETNDTYSRTDFEVNTCRDTYKWSDENNRYEATIPGGCGGTSFGGTISKLGYAKQVVIGDTEKIELYEYFAYEKPSFDSDIINYYSDYKRENLIDSTTEVYNNDEFFDKFSDKVGIYKYTFEKDKNNKYIFATVEKIK